MNDNEPTIEQRIKVLRSFRLVRRRNDRSPLRFNKDDNKNSHRAETEVGLRLMGQPSRLELITRSNSKCRCTFPLEPIYPASDGGSFAG